MARTAGRAPLADGYASFRQGLAELHRIDPFSRYGVHSIGIGRKIIAGKHEDRLALRFYVACKIAAADLPPGRRIPPSFRIRVADEDRDVELATDVIATPAPRPFPDLESVVRPVPGGVSCSALSSVGTGTIGGWVWDNTDDTIVMLSNQHVFGTTLGGVIIQPGTSDGGVSPQDRIGIVKRSIALDPYVPATPAECRNFVDAAIGEADSSELFDLTVVDIGAAVYDTAEAAVGDALVKTGQTTGTTTGVITDADLSVIMPFPDGVDYVICDCFRVEPADPQQLWLSYGDSGSLVFRNDGGVAIKPVLGLNYAGGGVPPNNYGIACKIGHVFAELDLGPLCTAGCAAFVDALYADDADAPPGGVAPFFTLSERARERSRRFHTGLTLDLQRRLLTSTRGRAIVAFVNRHRAELLGLLVGDGDLRRALVAALGPLLRGAVTTSDILERRIEPADAARIDRLAQVGGTKGSDALRKSLKPVHLLFRGAAGRTLGEIFEIRP
jgi:hypothetical protein